jgi:small nuclear ribonucleoprotein (snRNP)-like protein
MTIDLSQYVGKIITVRLNNGNILSGQLIKHSRRNDLYNFRGFCYDKEGMGFNCSSIVKVISVEKFTGITQRAPNINLDDFVGQKVYVKLARGSEHIETLDDSYYLNGIAGYSKEGVTSSPGWSIVEIYGEGAYEISTKSTFDNPNDYKIEQARQLLSQMSEEQVAKLLKSLK